MNVVLLGSNTKEEIENNLRIVASAGALSRSEGTVMDVYESKNDYQKSRRKRYSKNFRAIKTGITNSCRHKTWYFYSGYDKIYYRWIGRASEK